MEPIRAAQIDGAREASAVEEAPHHFRVGAGIYDITGPAADTVMMGFAVPAQKTSGIHLRLRSRAFVIADANKRVVFVSADLGMLFQMVKLKVCQRIAEDSELSRHYDERNVLLSATHTHGGPGGYSGYLLYDISNKGFIKKNFEAIVEGIFQSIARAHRNLEPAKIYVSQSTLEGVGGNRAEEPYRANPAEERALYTSVTDTSFTLLKFVSLRGEQLGTVNWFAVHPDSIGPQNTLITGDNKGYASYLFEREKGTDYTAEKTFVAAFAQANAGDVTPNIGFGQAPQHVRLQENPSLCNAVLSQYAKAKELYEDESQPVVGAIDFRHEWVDMRALHVESVGSSTCPAAMGASFSAGSPLDNPSPMPLFRNGTTNAKISQAANPRDRRLLMMIRWLLGLIWPASRNASYHAAHAEKPVLLPTGALHFNRRGQAMVPQIMPLQILRIGNVAIVAVPSEVTTMAGRRLKRAVAAALGVDYPVVAALSNSYASYLTTREEYAEQWYEGACTPFGPHQHAGFLQEFVKLSRAMVTGSDVPRGPTPPDITHHTSDFNRRFSWDRVPASHAFGDVRTQPRDTYQRGETVVVRFWSANPSNDYRTQDTFLVVEKRVGGQFVPVARDSDPEALFEWRRCGFGCSEVTISWDTEGAAAGVYRIRHKGNRKKLWPRVVCSFEGTTKEFVLC